MRHGDKVNALGRTAAHRRALLANLAIALIEHKRITTTLAKAKALRRYIEPLITKAKTNSTHSRRVVFSYLQNKEAIKELFGEIANRIGDRPGGYVRVIKLGFRRGDGAETALIELVDFNETYNPNAGKEKKSKRTRRGGAKKSEDAGVAAETAETVTVEETATEVVEDVVEEVENVAAEATAEVEAAAEEVVETVEEAVAEATEEITDTPAEEEKPASDEEEKKDA